MFVCDSFIETIFREFVVDDVNFDPWATYGAFPKGVTINQIDDITNVYLRDLASAISGGADVHGVASSGDEFFGTTTVKITFIGG